VRWGAVRPLSIACHLPAQATRFGTLGTGADQCPSSLASLGVCIPTINLDLGFEPPAHLPRVIARVKGGLYARQAVPMYLVNSQEVADLRRYYQRHAKSDRTDARMLARLPLVNPDKLHRLVLPSATAFACQRACKQLDHLATQITAVKREAAGD